MKRHALHLITTGTQELDQVEAVVRRLPAGTIDVLHIREKHRSARDHLVWYERLSAELPAVSIYINDRLDAAAAVRAPGVQLGYTSVPAARAAAILPAGTRIGCSVHSADEAAAAVRDGADYVLFGHIFETGSKAGLPGRGTGQLERIVKLAGIPVIAIGGITSENVHEVLATGCAGVAVMSSIFRRADPEKEAIKLREAVDRFPASPAHSFFIQG